MNEQVAVASLRSDPYTSRVSDVGETASRADPVVWNEGSGPLGSERLEHYSRNGFLSFDQLFGREEASGMLREANRLAETVQPDAPGVVIEPDSRAVRSVFRVHRLSAAFRAACTDARIVAVVRHLLGSEVYIHQSRINYKPGFCGKEFFWHSDFETWHVEDGMPRMRAVSVSVNLTENNEFNGPLMLVAGSHRVYVRCAGETPEDHYKQSLRKQEHGVPSQEILQQLVEDGGGITAPKGGPGSAVAFECNTMHGSVGNLSPYPRTNLFVVYNSVDNALVRPFGGTRPRPEFLGEREVVPVSVL